jgi:hypothetical protein
MFYCSYTILLALLSDIPRTSQRATAIRCIAQKDKRRVHGRYSVMKCLGIIYSRWSFRARVIGCAKWSIDVSGEDSRE